MAKTSIFDIALDNITGVLANAVNTTDKALLIEKEIGLESIYTLIAMGKSLVTIADSLKVSTFELEFILKRTSHHRKQFLNASTISLTKDSLEVLNNRSKITEIDTDESAALKHHSSMLDRSLKIVNTQEQDTGTGNIVVNNTVVVRNANDIPPMPNDLKKIIEGEKC